ncbi:MAG TPA: sensor histidine kinase [Acidimicrobiales bacterium]|jgi:signal transduction histidine kinase|nr:sensor histidine kinase [Acidimicrobiales bacterium]
MSVAGLRVAPGGVGLAVGAVALLRMALSIDFGSQADADTFFWYVELAAAFTAAAAGSWLVWRSPTSAAGWMLQLASVALALSALTATAATLEGSWRPFGSATLDVQLWTNLLGRAVLIATAIVAIPDRLVSGRVGGGVGTALAAAAVVGVTAALLVRSNADALVDTPLGFGNRAWVEAASGIGSWIFLALLAIHAASLVLLARQRGGEPTLFQVVGWTVAACATPAAFPAVADRLPAPVVDVMAAVALPILPVVSVVALLRALSWTVGRLVSRSIVWGLLSLAVVLVQALAVAVAASLGTRIGFTVAVAATVLFATGFQAARGRLQASVDRLLYGAGRDPWRALDDIGLRMEVAADHDTVLPELASAIAEAFGTAVVIELATAACEVEAARAGAIDPAGHTHEWPLVHQGERVGTLSVVAPANAGLRSGDVAALANLARQAAVAAFAVRTATELRRSKADLVAAVEEERKRLQHDLHDGLGPRLAGVALGIRAARNQYAAGGDPDDLLALLTDEVEGGVEDVRRIVHDLRPAALDQLGLVGAIRAYAERCSTAELSVTVDVADQIPMLSAATEVAAYRITTEAITNVTRHARARHCRVRIGSRTNGIVVEVEDDGVGLGDGARGGLGLASMRDRSASVGGRLLIDVAPTGGVRLVADLPGEVRPA